MTARRAWWAIPAAIGILAAACSSPPTAGDNQAADDETGDDGAADNGAADDGLPECPLDALEEATGPVEVRLWFGGIGGPVQETLEDMVARFNDSQDQVVVTAATQGTSFDEVFRNFESAASANQAPDLVQLSDNELRTMVDRGEVLPAEACMEADGFDVADIDPVVRANYTVDGTFYPGFAWPTSQILYFNKAHWTRAGLDPNDPPQTLDEVAEAARVIKEAGVADKPFAFKTTESLFKKWLNGVGVDMVDAGNGREGLATEATFNTPEAVELLEQLRAMDDESLLNPFPETEGGIDQFLALVTQESSMLIESSGTVTGVVDALSGTLTPEDVGADFDPSGVDLDQVIPGTAPFPGVEPTGDTLPGGGIFFILNTSDPAQQAGSWKFLRFMLESDNVRQWHLRGSYLPVRTSTQDDPQLQEFWENDLAGALLRTSVDQLQAADPDQPGPLIGPFTDFSDALDQMMEAVLINDADIQSALDRAEETVTAALERYAG